MLSASVTRSVVAFGLLLSLGLTANAKQSLSEEELDQTNAGGITVRVVSDEPETVEVDSSDLFLNQLFGQNEVITRIVVDIVKQMDFDFAQSNRIAQTKDTEELEAISEAGKNVSMVVEGSDQEGGFKAVINNVAGANQVETSINISVFVPVRQGGFGGSYSNPFSVSGGNAPAPATGATAPARSTLQPSGPQFEMPTTLNGAMSLMESLGQQHPQAASGLNSGISEIQSLAR